MGGEYTPLSEEQWRIYRNQLVEIDTFGFNAKMRGWAKQ
jgi:hypothetical protein